MNLLMWNILSWKNGFISSSEALVTTREVGNAFRFSRYAYDDQGYNRECYSTKCPLILLSPNDKENGTKVGEIAPPLVRSL